MPASVRTFSVKSQLHLRSFVIASDWFTDDEDTFIDLVINLPLNAAFVPDATKFTAYRDGVPEPVDFDSWDAAAGRVRFFLSGFEEGQEIDIERTTLGVDYQNFFGSFIIPFFQHSLSP